MSALSLRSICRDRNIPLAAVASAAGVSRSAISQLANRGQWPATDAAGVRDRITQFLQARGIHADWARKEKAPTRANASGPVVPNPVTSQESNMVLLKVGLSEAARKAWGITRDPFGPPIDIADVFLGSPDIRYVREAMVSTAKHGGFLGVLGESGAGKSTLREELVDRLRRENQPVIVIEPRVEAMEESDSRGKPLRSLHIAEALMATVAPLTRVASSPDARLRQLHSTLKESARTGHKHLLMIEEAHALPVPTLKHLKRFLEMKDGLKPLLSILLIGQPELRTKLNPANPELREVVQRIELIDLPPLDEQLVPYLTFRFERVGVKLGDVVEPGALDALRAVMTDSTGTSRGAVSRLHPLAVHNLLTRALNLAARVGAPKVTADIVREGAR